MQFQVEPASTTWLTNYREISTIRKYFMLKKLNCQTLSRFLLNMFQLEFGKGVLSDQIWADFYRDDIILVLDIKHNPATFQTLG